MWEMLCTILMWRTPCCKCTFACRQSFHFFSKRSVLCYYVYSQSKSLGVSLTLPAVTNMPLESMQFRLMVKCRTLNVKDKACLALLIIWWKYGYIYLEKKTLQWIKIRNSAIHFVVWNWCTLIVNFYSLRYSFNVHQTVHF